MDNSKRSLPIIDDINEGYWRAAKQRKLAIQKCKDCGHLIHPPRSTCPKCQSESLEFIEVSGRGTIYSYSTMHYPGNPGFDDLPFAVIIVELAEQKHLKVVGNLLDTPHDEIEIGADVKVAFELITEDIVLPQWRLKTSA